MNIGENIKNRREEKEIPQMVLAAEVGITQQALWNFEKGFKVPGLLTAKRIADALDTTLDDLVRDDDESINQHS